MGLENRALIVLNRLEGSLCCYELGDGHERFRLPTAAFPHELCLAPDRRRLFVTEYGVPSAESDGEGGNTIAVFDLRAHRRVGTIRTGKYRRPHGITAHHGGRLFVTSEARGTLLVLRLEDHSVLHAVDIEQDMPQAVAVSPDGRTAFTANIGSGSVSAVDVMMGVVLRHVPVLDRPGGLACSPDGGLLYVANRESAAISIVDAVRLEVVGRIETGRGPVRIAVTPDGRRIAFPLFDEDAVQVADAETRAVTQTIPVGRQPVGAAMSADGEHLFVSCERERRVDVVSLAEGRVVATVATGEGPGGIAWLELADLEGWHRAGAASRQRTAHPA
jgi:YVTN family beta-propeller protein